MDRFLGPGTPLSPAGWEKARSSIGCAAEALWSVLSVETSGCGYLRDRSPKILFERHVFHRLTNGKFDAQDPDVSQPTAGGYGDSGAHQYVRLQAAMLLDEHAALSSASWGLGQIMGGNHKAAGYDTVAAMVQDFVVSEDAQLAGMARFIGASGLSAAASNKQWTRFARIYNGPDYAKNKYDALLQSFCANFEMNGCPDLALRAAQIYLTYRGLSVGGIDGVKGKMTTAALKTFQKSAGLPVTGQVDDATLQSLAR